WLSDFVWEPSGTVNTVKVGGVTVKGGEVRTLLGLRSACFGVSVSGEEMTFHVTGYGHGVGMSQYGANAMARQGKQFRDILCWYYTGTQVTALEDVE
ncbi:MAG: stage II sporulation protein D, partial [Oscillospiraceae bacterium]|nr:stage II sporulation protein D [Oscillospiraceae bacterium]